MNLLERLATDALNDDYFNELYEKINNIYYKQTFQEFDAGLTEKQYVHIMRFCDILSNSNEAKHRNTDYKIISMLLS